MERKLTAIFCADVFGYSRLTGEDEEATHRTLMAYRKVVDGLIEQHRGRFVHSAGDGVLAEFASVVNAVQCAVAIQSTLKVENARLPAERRMEFRIGINLGDVMADGVEIYGDGVNVAARLESLADPGAILISGSVREQLGNKLALYYADLGEREVKNISHPVRIFRVLQEPCAGESTAPKAGATRKYVRRGVFSLAGLGVIVATIVLVQHVSLKPPHTHASIPPPEEPALPLPSIPSIAVLPFANLSGDPKQDYFSDGITEDLVTDLARVPGLFVIDRGSTFAYKGKPTPVQQVGRELGVKYVLEGSARKEADRVRIDVQLVDASTANQVWGQRYDKQLSDVFALQDEIVRSLVTTLKLQLPLLKQGYVIPQSTKNLEAYDYHLHAWEYLLNLNPQDGFAKVRESDEKAIELDPGYSDAYALLGYSYVIGYIWQWDRDPTVLDRAAELANKSIALDESQCAAYAVRGWVRAVKGQHDEAIADGKRAVALDPNSAFAFMTLASINLIVGAGNPEEVLSYSQKAMRLDPDHRKEYGLEEGEAYNRMHRYPEAVDALRRANQNNPFVHLGLILAYSELDREPEARAEAAEVLRLSPGFSLEQLQKRLNWQDPFHEQFLADLHKAGLK